MTTYRINQDSTNVRWIVACDDTESECAGGTEYDTYSEAKRAAMQDARRRKLARVYIKTRGHEGETFDVD